MAIEDAKEPPPTPENMAAITTMRAETSGLERAMAVHRHGIASRIEVKYTTLRPPTSGTTKELGRRQDAARESSGRADHVSHGLVVGLALG